MKEKTKRKLRYLFQNALGRLLVNSIRFFQSLYSAPTSVYKDLTALHCVRLKAEKNERNLSSLLFLSYIEKLGIGASARNFYRAHEFQDRSQNGEDGLLAYVLSKIGVTNRFFVEFGAGGYTSNTLFLVERFAWNGLSLDGDRESIASRKTLYETICASDPDRSLLAKTKWITRNNVNEILAEENVPFEPDLFSIDLDGIDYWLWESISAIKPRVVIAEYNASFGKDAEVTIPYRNDFFRWSNDLHPDGWYYGASLAALTKLAARKGYGLVACESSGVNVVFVRKDLLVDSLSVQTVSEAYYPDARRLSSASLQEQIDSVSKYPLIEV